MIGYIADADRPGRAKMPNALKNGVLDATELHMRSDAVANCFVQRRQGQEPVNQLSVQLIRSIHEEFGSADR